MGQPQNNDGLSDIVAAYDKWRKTLKAISFCKLSKIDDAIFALSGLEGTMLSGTRTGNRPVDSEELLTRLFKALPYIKEETAFFELMTRESMGLTEAKVLQLWKNERLQSRILMFVNALNQTNPSTSDRAFPQDRATPPAQKRERVAKRNTIAELITLDSTWQKTNVGEEGEPLLLIRIGFGRCRVIDDDVEYDIVPHRVQLRVHLDGGSVQSREAWIVHNENNPPVGIRVIPWDNWQTEHPGYDLDAEASRKPLVGSFDYFPLCTVGGRITGNERVEVGFFKSQIKSQLPREYERRLADMADPHPFSNKPDILDNQRLIENWIRDRYLKDHLRDGGVFVVSSSEIV